MVLSGQKRSKVAPRRHVSSIRGLLYHSRHLHQAFSALDREDSRAQRRLSLTRLAALPSRCAIGESSSAAHALSEPSARQAVVKPLVFRKTKREVERERERALQEQIDLQKLQDMANSIIATCMRTSSTAAKSKLRPSCRAEYLRDVQANRLGNRGRSRRRLLF